MSAFDVVSVIALAIFIMLWLVYAWEAWRQDPRQGLFVLLIPLYVLYFAHLRSPRGPVLRWALFGAIVVALIGNAAAVWGGG